MPLRYVVTALLLAAMLPARAGAQDVSLHGRFRDAATRDSVPGVSVRLANTADTSDVHRLVAREDGTFEVTGLGRASYRLEARRVGYAPLRLIIAVTQAGQDAGVLLLTPQPIQIRGLSVEESPPPATQKGDTTEFRAGAVQTHKDATAEELVQKLPGVTIENGQVKAQGENVQRVLVNGREFFGSDPTAAMRNLPADVIDRIQVYDRQSDQADFSGFDDGRSEKTMNFVLRDQKVQFGKAYGGYGDRDRYQAGANASVVRGGRRVTLIGLSNNINQRNFSPQDLAGVMGGGGARMIMFGGGGRGPGGGGQMVRIGGGGGFGGGAFDPGSFLVSGQPGLNTTHSGGINVVDQWGPKVTLSSSMFVNHTDTDNAETLLRGYQPPQDSVAFYDQQSSTDSHNGNERLDTRLEWTLDSLNSVIVQPRLYFQQNRSTNSTAAANRSAADVLQSAATGGTTDHVDADNLSTRVTLRHRFARRGRNVSADVNVGQTLRDGDGAQQSLTQFFEGSGAPGDTVKQRSDTRTRTQALGLRVAWTEPLARALQLQAVWNPSRTISTSDARTRALDAATGAYTDLDTALSNSYASRTTSHNGGLSLLYARGPWKLLTTGALQQTRLHSDEHFPAGHPIDRTFDDVLPAVTFTGTFANRRNMRLAYSTSVNPPSISQLQNVVNNANPLSLTTGNPELVRTYAHTFSLRLSEANPMQSRSRFVFGNLTRTLHAIGNATFTAPQDTTIDGVFLARGTQLTRPENLGASWNGNLFAVYSRPVRWLGSLASVVTGGTWTRTPTRLNGITNVRDTWAVRPGITLASTISPNLDFTISYFGTWNLSRTDLTAARSGDYYTHTFGLRVNATVGPGIVVRQEMNHLLQSGVPSAYGQNVLLWNSTVGKKFLKDDRGELRITATDVLAQDRSVARSITDTYVQDTRDRTLGRFVQAVFTYTFGGRPPEGRGMMMRGGMRFDR